MRTKWADQQMNNQQKREHYVRLFSERREWQMATDYWNYCDCDIFYLQTQAQ